MRKPPPSIIITDSLSILVFSPRPPYFFFFFCCFFLLISIIFLLFLLLQCWFFVFSYKNHDSILVVYWKKKYRMTVERWNRGFMRWCRRLVNEFIIVDWRDIVSVSLKMFLCFLCGTYRNAMLLSLESLRQNVVVPLGFRVFEHKETVFLFPVIKKNIGYG